MHYVYIVRCSDDTLYTGWTNHLKERILAHNEGRGAKYTKQRRPVELVYTETFENKSEALKREIAIKKLNRRQKMALIGQEERMKKLLFDLDGTLLPMDQDHFVESYLKRLAVKMIPYGYDPKLLTQAVWKGTEAMVRNDGSRTNEEAFWETFSALMGKDTRADEPIFEEFYRNEFQEVAKDCGFQPETKRLILELKEKGFDVVLATNPLFPKVATESRIRWTGLEPSDFRMVTTYESCRYCKPNPAYYQEICDKLGYDPADCIMVGNDADEDTAAAKIGMEVFLLTDCLLNRHEKDISQIPHGDFADLRRFLFQQQ